jgi:hypothetical protein
MLFNSVVSLVDVKHLQLNVEIIMDGIRDFEGSVDVLFEVHMSVVLEGKKYM